MNKTCNDWTRLDFPDRPKTGMYWWVASLDQLHLRKHLFVDKTGMIHDFSYGFPTAIHNTNTGNGGWWYRL